MNALRAAWLTWKLHRFESVVAFVLMLTMAISAGIVTLHLRALTIPAGCWDWPGVYTSELCRRLVDSHHDIVGAAGGHVRIGFLGAPTLIGLMLGSTLVGRELELRTASLAWSLDGARLRWLAQRLGGALVLACVGLITMAWMGSGFEAASRTPGDLERVGELATRGVPLLTRGLAALGIAVLAGAVLGRTVPALLIATIAVGVLWYVGSGASKVAAGPFAVWIDDAQRREGDYVHVVRYDEFDTTQPGRHGEPGARIDSGEAYQKGLLLVCGAEPEVHDEAYEVCVNVYDPSMVHGWWLAVPASALPVIEGVQAGLDLAVGGLALAGTVVIVRHRRPD
ncbi:MAG: hypothetical protein KF809_15255 [Chloroflexi bacterium]|nr:hypothetical protein [Chloroflexota bacterium]